MPLHMSEDERVEGPLAWSVFKATTPNDYLSRLPAHIPISPTRPGRLPSPAPVEPQYCKAEMDRSPNTSGYSRFCESRPNESTELRDQLVQRRASQSDTRILRGARGGLFSGELVFKAVGPSVLGFLFGGVGAW